MGPQMASGGNFSPFMDTLRECSNGWKKVYLVNFGYLTNNTLFYNELFNYSRQPEKLLTTQFSQLREMHIDDILDYSGARYLLAEEQCMYGLERDTYAFFTAAGHMTASMPVLEEMEICMRITTGWRCAEKCLHYKCKIKEMCFGSGIPRSGFKAELNISETYEEASTAAVFKAVRVATEASWTSSVERIRGGPLRLTWHEHVYRQQIYIGNGSIHYRF